MLGLESLPKRGWCFLWPTGIGCSQEALSQWEFYITSAKHYKWRHAPEVKADELGEKLCLSMHGVGAGLMVLVGQLAKFFAKDWQGQKGVGVFTEKDERCGMQTWHSPW